MRSTESNLRGLRSESGIRTENSDSSAVTRSGSVKESSRPDSNSDSPGSKFTGFPATRRTMSTILLCWSMGLIGFQSGLLKVLVLRHEVVEEGGCEPFITIEGKVGVVGLGQSGGEPVR